MPSAAKPRPRRAWVWLPWAWAALFSGSAIAVGDDPPRCRDDLVLVDGYHVRSVSVRARWGWTPPLKLAIEPGQVFDPAQLSQAVSQVSEALRQPAARGIEQGEVFSVSWVTSCVRADEPARLVDVEIRPATITSNFRRDLLNFLPVARSNLPTFYSAVPKPLLALNPRFGFQHDAAFGPSAHGEITVKSGGRSVARPVFALKAAGRKSLSEPFYTSTGELNFGPAGGPRRWAILGAYDADRQPLGDDQRLRNLGRAGFSGEFDLHSGWLTGVSFGADYLRSSNRFAEERSREHSLRARLFLDARLAKTVSRLGLWVDANSPDGARSYRRVAAAAGFRRDFFLRPHQAIGVEALVSAGKTWGATPRHARFYAGNSFSEFLYEAPDSPELGMPPQGPLFRASGVGRAGAADSVGAMAGADSFFGLSLNLTIPVPPWSSPLIPEVVVNENPRKTLADVLQGQVNGAEFFLIESLKKQGMTSAQAEAEAKRILADVRPAVRFLAQDANLVAVRPLMMLDLARLDPPGTGAGLWRVGVGGGVQLTVAIARFEFGYVRAVKRLPGDDAGSFVGRLVFENLF